MIRGDEKEHYIKLAEYGGELRDRNPGSEFRIQNNLLHFERAFISVAACKNGFLSRCRPIISIDGCFIKESYEGQILSAIGIDANDCIYPIAYVVVESECMDSWAWFLFILKQQLGIIETKY